MYGREKQKSILPEKEECFFVSGKIRFTLRHFHYGLNYRLQ